MTAERLRLEQLGCFSLAPALAGLSSWQVTVEERLGRWLLLT